MIRNVRGAGRKPLRVETKDLRIRVDRYLNDRLEVMKWMDSRESGAKLNMNQWITLQFHRLYEERKAEVDRYIKLMNRG